MTIDKLAEITMKGFNAVDKRFDEADKRFEQIDKRFDEVDRMFEIIEGQIGGLDRRLDYHADAHVSWDAHTRLEKRVVKLEHKSV